MESLIKETEEKVSKEQGGKGCVNQVFKINIMVEVYVGKDAKLYVALMDLEKA